MTATRAVLAAAAVAATAGALSLPGNAAAASPPAATPLAVPAAAMEGPSAQVATSTTLPGVSTRAVFSANPSTTSSDRALTVRNLGSATLSVSSVSISGTSAASFRVVSPTGAFSVPAQGSVNVTVRFHPASGTSLQQRATATVHSDDAAHPAIALTLAGVRSPGTDGTGEPSAADLINALGYLTKIGTEGTSSNYVGNTRTPRGDELISPYWLAADTSKAVQLRPVARYAAHNLACPCARTQWAHHYPDAAHPLFSFGADNASGTFGAGNERLFPSYTGSTTFDAGSSSFQLFSDSGLSSDDARNANQVHNWRFYPAKNANGTVVANTWLGLYDLGTDPASKNWDYQDVVYLLTNAKPALTTGPSPASSEVHLGFDASTSGTVPDSQGLGTGFTSVQGNDDGTQYDPNRLRLDTSAGQLRITPQVGTFVGDADDQVNAVQLSFDATRSRTTAATRISPPLTTLTGGAKAGLFVGPDQSNLVVVDVASADGYRFVVSMTYEAYTDYPYEHNSAGRVVASAAITPHGSNVHSIDLGLELDPSTGKLTGKYRANAAALTTGEAWSTLGTVAPRDVMRWLSTQARAGVRTHRDASTAPNVIRFDAMRVDPT